MDRTEIWLEFIKQNWLLFLIALLVLFVIINFTKTMVKWALIVVIVIAVAVYSGIAWKDVHHVVMQVKDEAIDTLKEQAIQSMIDEVGQAAFTFANDGTYRIQTSSLEMNGTPNQGKVKVSFHGISLGEWEINESIRQFIQTARQNQ